MKKTVFIISGPSGVGKGTIVKSLLKDEELKLRLSVSATSRAIRSDEVDGREYHFFSKDEFQKMIDEKKFIESSQHFDNYYGTLFSEISLSFEKGMFPLLEIEVDGAQNVVKEAENNGLSVISIFIQPPSKETLLKRLKARDSETDEQIQSRLERYDYELKRSEKFTATVVNDTLEEAVQKIKEIIMKAVGD